MKIYHPISMPFIRKNLPFVITSAVILLLCISFYFLFQNKFIYTHFASHVVKNYYHEDKGIIRGEVPFEQFKQSKMLHWDAQLYLQIRENGYDMESAGGDYIFAFFPLFPLVWKITHMSPSAIGLFNYFLFVISIIVIFNYLKIPDGRQARAYLMVSICVPLLVVFLIPYSEGLFMLTATFALWGIYQNRYSVYFLAAMCMSMTRPSAIIIGIALLLTEVYFCLRHRNFKTAVHSFGLKMLPLLLGTLVVSFIQMSYGSDSLLKFIEVQKYWDSGLQFPRILTDWAHEQFGTNVSLLLLLIPASTAYLLFHSINSIFKKAERPHKRFPYTEDHRKEYLFVLSLCFIMCITLSILFLRGGSLHGISRYVFCTPFYYIVLFMLREKTAPVGVRLKMLFFVSALLLTASVLSFAEYSKSWNFADAGFVLFYLQLSFFIFANLIRKKWLIALHVIVCSIWTSYLFNMFISNAWIFT